MHVFKIPNLMTIEENMATLAVGEFLLEDTPVSS